MVAKPPPPVVQRLDHLCWLSPHSNDDCGADLVGAPADRAASRRALQRVLHMLVVGSATGAGPHEGARSSPENKAPDNFERRDADWKKFSINMKDEHPGGRRPRQSCSVRNRTND